MIELKDCKNEGNEYHEEIKERYKNIPMIGLGIGIPTLSNQATKYAKYVINRVAAQQIFDEELDFGDEE
jgi:hypothetical protein